ncbi:MAG: Mov34/MPN/PAD-1 family protein [Thaumarchaeota archaeon]|nr:Mov34/MPN/PAD-1 family protein [Candidatus Geocrenenecus arthurdayi]MCL7389132.1 Mov34/MPN/PAD-1 family protein [Candidatus Geocrenenecus arthurdayi]MCL7391534.1 Mov34/MPN/PAD-1 family protein [Candidatus Geocrenenecus arthurdayi]MCL7402962.1 Mov34/MPN/PAD-1 family protein [Candidatus Geocrenenecus arthurdayi]
MFKKVVLTKNVAYTLLEIARNTHPREMLMLLRGKKKKDFIKVDEVLFAPLSQHGESSATFRFDLLPIDFTIIGLAHSHPSGYPYPSLEDLNHFIGSVMLILTPPYRSLEDIHAYNPRGERVGIYLED